MSTSSEFLSKAFCHAVLNSSLNIQQEKESFHARNSFHFQKIPVGLNINICYVKICLKLPFTLKNKLKENKNEIWVLKITVLNPRKSAFLVFEEKTPKQKIFVFLLWFSFKNNRRTNGGKIEREAEDYLTLPFPPLSFSPLFITFFMGRGGGHSSWQNPR